MASSNSHNESASKASSAISAFIDWSGLREESEEVVDQFLNALVCYEYNEGDYIIREGATGNSFYIIESGSVGIKKESDGQGEISVLFSGDFFGELALITDAPRLASVVAREPVTVHEISQEKFEKLAKLNPRIYGKILKKLYDRLKDSYIDLEVTNEQLEVINREKEELSLLFAATVFLISIYAFIINYFQSDLVLNLPDSEAVRYGMSRFVEITGLFVIYLIVRKSQMPLSAFGITLKDAGKTIRESLIFTAVLVVIITGFAYWLVYEESGSLFHWDVLSWMYVAYLFIVPIQEFIMRGVVQNSVSRLLTGRYLGIMAVLITSLIFGALHLHASLNMGIAALISGILWGALYLRHKSLIGVCISHYIIGCYLELVGLWDLL